MSTLRTGPPSLKKPSPWGKIAPLVPVLVVAIVALVVAVPVVVERAPESRAPSSTERPSPRTRAIMRDCRAQLGDVPACARLGRDAARRERYVTCRTGGLSAWRCLGLPPP